MPAHTHTLQGSERRRHRSSGLRATCSRAPRTTVYGPPGASTTLSPQAVANAGSGTPHPNMQPYLVLNFVIALQGLFPPRN